MHYIYESLFVGAYSCILYLLVPINDAKIALFAVGFLKHYLGNWLGNTRLLLQQRTIL